MLLTSLRNAVKVLVMIAFGCAMAMAQPNKTSPYTGIAWPANCNASGTVAYNFLTNTCFAAGTSTAPIVYKGTWSGSTSYVKTSSEVDAVFYAGSQWITLVNANLNHQPDVSPSQWALLISGIGGVPSINGLTTPFVLGTGATCTTTSGTTTCTFSSSNVVASPQFRIAYYSGSGTASQLTGDSGFTTDGAGNITLKGVAISGNSYSGFIDMQAVSGTLPTQLSNSFRWYTPAGLTGLINLSNPTSQPGTNGFAPTWNSDGTFNSWSAVGGGGCTVNCAFTSASTTLPAASFANSTTGPAITATSGTNSGEVVKITAGNNQIGIYSNVSSGYATVNLIDHTGASVGGFGYGESGSVYPNKFFLYAPTDYCITAIATVCGLTGSHTDNSVTLISTAYMTFGNGLQIGPQAGGASNYSDYSFNGVHTNTGRNGCVGGNTGSSDPAIYCNVPSGGVFNWLVNAVGVGNMGTVGLTTLGVSLTSAAATAPAATIALGSTTAASTNCGTLAGSASCWVINVAGTTRYVPIY